MSLEVLQRAGAKESRVWLFRGGDEKVRRWKKLLVCSAYPLL